MRIAGAALAVMLIAGCGGDDEECPAYSDHLDRTCYVDARELHPDSGGGFQEFLFCEGPCVPDGDGVYCAEELIGPCYASASETGGRCMSLGEWYCRRF